MTSFYLSFRKDIMKSLYENVYNLKVTKELLSFVNDELLKNTGINPKKFWSGFDKVVHEIAPKNRELIKIREDLQKKIDDWHIANKGNIALLNKNYINSNYLLPEDIESISNKIINML